MNQRAQTESHFISAPDGLRLHARAYGPRTSDLTPIVCLPGLTRNGDDFDVRKLWLRAQQAARAGWSQSTIADAASRTMIPNGAITICGLRTPTFWPA